MHGIVVVALVALVITGGFFPRTVRSAPRQPELRAELISLPGLGGVSEPSRILALGGRYAPIVPPVPELIPTQPRTDASPAIDGGADAEGPDQGSAEPESGREEEQLPLRYRYVVVEGDTVLGIAYHFGIDADYIVWNNIDTLPNADLLRPGQQLQIPSVEGIIHDVRLHETLSDIAEMYDAKLSEIIAFPANNLADPNLLLEGSTILVPGGRVVAVPPPPPPPPPKPPTPGPVVATATPTPTVSSGFGFIWPAQGTLTSSFGPGHRLGIDIAMKVGSPVAASAAGQVTFVGGNPCCSYGYYVIIKHDETFTTRYGHFSSFNVVLGQWVEQGDLIGYSGSTGSSTGPHVHFEVRRKGVVQNPLDYLP